MLTSEQFAARRGVQTGGRIVEIPDADRHDLATWFAEEDFTTGAEVGVERGVYSKALLRRNPGLHLYCIDPWTAYQGYREHVSQDKLDGFYEETATRLAPYKATLVRAFSVEAASRFEPGSLDFVYIDANHELSHVIADLTAWAPKVRKGGIVAGHDYISRTKTGYQMHVVEALDAYTRAWQIAPLFLVGRKEMVDGERRDTPRSWLWVVE